ncbi:TPA: hypothetical protein QH056_001825 [Klebsiella oxytoca]|nr:hypothetical protein [Klebsiella oxytoca]
MTIEASQFINTLNTSFPRSTDLLKEGDDHIRLIKANLKNTFPNITNSVAISSDTLNYLNSSLTATPAGIKFNSSVSIANGSSVDFSSTETKVGNALGDPNAFNQLAAVNVATLSVLFKAMFPVGSVYCTGDNNLNPGSLPLFKGTSWVPFGAGRYMVSAGNGGDFGPWGIGLGTSGSAGFTIGYANMPQHTHQVSVSGTLNGATGSMNRNWSHSHTLDMAVMEQSGSGTHTGQGSTGHNWRQPYTTATDTNHEHSVSVSGSLGGATGGVDQGSGQNAINFTPAFTSSYYWKRTS